MKIQYTHNKYYTVMVHICSNPSQSFCCLCIAQNVHTVHVCKKDYSTVSHTAYMLKVHMISLGSQVHSSVMFVDTNINLRKVLGIW